MTGPRRRRLERWSACARSHSIVLVQNVIPDYRTRFFEDLAGRLDPRLVVLAGEEDWHPDVRHVGAVPHVRVRNVFLFGRRLLWQKDAIRPLLAADIAVMGLNPRILSNWLPLIARRIAGRRTVLWGHAWPRRGRESSTDKVRSIMRNLAHTIIVYTETEARELKAATPSIDVVAAPNALYRRHELGVRRPADGRTTDIVCVGRLTLSKRPSLLLQAFEDAVDMLPHDVRLIFVGDGPLRAYLEHYARRSNLQTRVVFTGHISSIDQLRAVYFRAIASVAPGEIGLSLIQSLGFGVPMIISHVARHGPEIEAARERVNVVTFEPGSRHSLAETIVAVVRDRDLWLARRDRIADSIRAHYCIEAMTESFTRALGVLSAPSTRHQSAHSDGP